MSVGKFDLVFCGDIDGTLLFIVNYNRKMTDVSLEVKLSKSLETKTQAYRLVELMEPMIKGSREAFVDLMHQIWNLPSDVYQLFTHILSVKVEATYEETQAGLIEIKENIQEYEIEQIIDKANKAVEAQLREAQEKRDAVEAKERFAIIMANQVNVKEFMDKIYEQKAFISASQGAYHIRLTLWKDARVPLTIEIPNEIGIADVEVRWVECHLPAPKIWTIPIGDLKSNQSKKYGWLDVRTEEKYMGFEKTIHVNGHQFKSEFDGSVLRLTVQKVYMPGGIEYALGYFSCFSVPLRIRTVVITCAYTDPLIGDKI